MTNTTILIIGIFIFGIVIVVCMTIDSVAKHKYGNSKKNIQNNYFPNVPLWTSETKTVKREPKSWEDVDK